MIDEDYIDYACSIIFDKELYDYDKYSICCENLSIWPVRQKLIK